MMTAAPVDPCYIPDTKAVASLLVCTLAAEALLLGWNWTEQQQSDCSHNTAVPCALG